MNSAAQSIEVEDKVEDKNTSLHCVQCNHTFEYHHHSSADENVAAHIKVVTKLF